MAHHVSTWPRGGSEPNFGGVVTVTHSGQRRTPKVAKTSSVAKKAVMAVSGCVLVLSLFAHMVGNLKLFSGAETFNGYSEWIRRIGEPAVPGQTLLWVIRAVLPVAVVAHAWAAASPGRPAHGAGPPSRGGGGPSAHARRSTWPARPWPRATPRGPCAGAASSSACSSSTTSSTSRSVWRPPRGRAPAPT